MSIETKARNKRFVQLAVTTALATTALTACTGKTAPSHSYSAAHAEQALTKGNASKAVRHAEAAVLASPRDAYTRTLLANAYLTDGRFASAATTFAEAIELGDTAPRTVISHALAQVAIGDQMGALGTLSRFEDKLDAADYGLAMALAGRPDHGVNVLGNALRGGQNTPKVRQNLAYAYAMLAAGGVDLVIESGLQIYDVQAFMPVVQGAGGVVTDWRGGDPSGGGQVVAAASQGLLESVLPLLAAAAR